MELNCKQNEEGMYEISGVYNNGEEFSTGFVFDSVKQWGPHDVFRVSQTDAEGHRKYGLIRSDNDRDDILDGGGIFYTSCIFDKIKPYERNRFKAYIGEEEFIIHNSLLCWCDVYKPDFFEIYESNKEKRLARWQAEILKE